MTYVSISGLMPSLKWLKTYSVSRPVPCNLGIRVLGTSLLAK
jgi:hypothetical protein